MDQLTNSGFNSLFSNSPSSANSFINASSALAAVSAAAAASVNSQTNTNVQSTTIGQKPTPPLNQSGPQQQQQQQQQPQQQQTNNNNNFSMRNILAGFGGSDFVQDVMSKALLNNQNGNFPPPPTPNVDLFFFQMNI